MSESHESFWKGMTWILVAYFAAFVVALLVGATMPTDDPFWVALAADCAATVVIFGFSWRFGNSSFYDAYWSVVPIAIVAYWIVYAGDDGNAVRQMLVLGVTAFWGTRLTTNWASGWTGLGHEDWRYIDLARKTGPFYWLVSFSGIHFFPTLIVFLGLWPAYRAVLSPAPLGLLDVLALLVAGGATVLEGMADRQLHAFRARTTNPQAVIEEGLWAWSRHPNYLGEISFWWGLWLFAVAADPHNVYTFPGALAMVLMFRFISIPMMETRMLQRRPAYAEVMGRVNMLVPWFPKPRPAEASSPAPAPAPAQPDTDALADRKVRLAIDTMPFIPPPEPEADED